MTNNMCNIFLVRGSEKTVVQFRKAGSVDKSVAFHWKQCHWITSVNVIEKKQFDPKQISPVLSLSQDQMFWRN